MVEHCQYITSYTILYQHYHFKRSNIKVKQHYRFKRSNIFIIITRRSINWLPPQRTCISPCVRSAPPHLTSTQLVSTQPWSDTTQLVYHLVDWKFDFWLCERGGGCTGAGLFLQNARHVYYNVIDLSARASVRVGESFTVHWHVFTDITFYYFGNSISSRT